MRSIVRASPKPITREHEIPQKFVLASLGTLAWFHIYTPPLASPPCLDLPVSTSPRLRCAAEMVAAANAELYTPFPPSLVIEDGIQSSEEGSTSDIHSPIFEPAYPEGEHSLVRS